MFILHIYELTLLSGGQRDGDMAWKLGNTAVKQDITVREHFTQ